MVKESLHHLFSILKHGLAPTPRESYILGIPPGLAGATRDAPSGTFEKIAFTM
jgi:hypothetical protein